MKDLYGNERKAERKVILQGFLQKGYDFRKDMYIACGCYDRSGVMVRSAGIAWDLQNNII